MQQHVDDDVMSLRESSGQHGRIHGLRDGGQTHRGLLFPATFYNNMLCVRPTSHSPSSFGETLSGSSLSPVSSFNSLRPASRSCTQTHDDVLRHRLCPGALVSHNTQENFMCRNIITVSSSSKCPPQKDKTGQGSVKTHKHLRGREFMCETRV